MQTQEYNAELVQNLRTAFPLRGEASYAWGRAVGGALQLTTHLRGFWPISSVDENLYVYDLSGQGRVMTSVNLTAAAFAGGSVVPYFGLNGINQFLTRPDEAGLRFTDGFTWLCWFYPSALAANMRLMAKANGVAFQENMLIARGDLAGDPIEGRIGTGAANLSVFSTNSCQLNAWNFGALRFIPSTSLDVFLNGIWTSLAAGIPATCFANAGPWTFGASNLGTAPYAGAMTYFGAWAKPMTDLQVNLAMYQMTRPLFYGV